MRARSLCCVDVLFKEGNNVRLLLLLAIMHRLSGANPPRSPGEFSIRPRL
jgi:hypothetical protein